MGVLDDFNDYFIETWLGDDSKFPIPLWNVFSVLNNRRTNNSVEVWNNKFFKLAGKAHPNIYEFLTTVKKEQAGTELKLAMQDAAIPPPAKKRKYQDINKLDYAQKQCPILDVLVTYQD